MHAARSCRWPGSRRSSGKVALDLVYDRAREGYDPLQKLLELFEGVNAKPMKAGRAEELRRAAAGRAPAAPDHRRRDERPGGRPGRGAADRPRAGDHQRHTAGGHEGRRRAVRLRPDAAAVRAPVRRGDEDRGRLPRTAHGEVRRRGQGHHRAGHGQAATSTTSARTWSTSSCPTTATTWSISASSSRSHAILEAAEEHRADVIGMSGLLVKSTVIMKENLEELNQRRLAGDFPVHPRRRRTDPRRTSSRTCTRSTRARSATPATRSRACG